MPGGHLTLHFVVFMSTVAILQTCGDAGVAHSAIYSKADTSKPDVKAIDINQKVAGMSQERGAIPLLYCCTADDLEGEHAPVLPCACSLQLASEPAHCCSGIIALPERLQMVCLTSTVDCTLGMASGKNGAYIGPNYIKGPINFNVGMTKERTPKNPEAHDLEKNKRLWEETCSILAQYE